MSFTSVLVFMGKPHTGFLRVQKRYDSMKPLTLRRTLVPLAAGLILSLLPFQIGFAQTDYFETAANATASASATASVDTVPYQNDGRTNGGKLTDDDWRRDWKERMDDWGRDWNSWQNDDEDHDQDWNTRDQTEAERAILRAEDAIYDFKADIKQLQRDRVHKDEIKDARKVLSNAKKELNDARRAYRKQNYREATERAEHAVELIEDWDDIDHEQNRARRAAAATAIEDAKEAIDEFKQDIKDWRRAGASNEDIKEAKRGLREAQDELSEAKRAFNQRQYDHARESAENVYDIIDDWDGDRDDPDDTNVNQACRLTDSQLATVANYPPENGPIVAFGDSLTAGVGSTGGNNYVNQLEELIEEDIINAGVSGDTTEEALARLQEDVLSHDPRAVIVWLGGNDHLARYYEEIRDRAEGNSFWEEVLESVFRLFGKEPGNSEILTETETFDNIETIVERIQATGAVTIIVGIEGQPLDKNLSRRYRQVAADTDSIFVNDVLSGIVGRPGRTASDLIHPNNAGYELVAERIFPAVACVAEENS